MEQAATISEALEDAEARRNAIVLAAANAINGSMGAIVVTLGGLAGSYLLGADKTLATVPIMAMNLGAALGAIPAAQLMHRIGRRLGFMVGTLFAIAGGLLAAFAVVVGSFVLLSLGTLIAGVSGAFLFQYRFAAAEGGGPARQARSISWVLVGGLVSAVIGPQAVIYTRDLFAPIPFAGAFVAIAVLSLVGLFVLSLLAGRAREAPHTTLPKATGRPLAEIAAQPRFIVAVICAMLAFGVMALVMTAAPIAMVACGLGEDDAALGIQWHVIAMFAPSFFTGSLIARFGKEPVMLVGLALLSGCAIAALAGLDLMNFWIALVLLGVGWNFTFIGATAMLTETYRPEERRRVEGFNDFLVLGTATVASFSSGSLLALAGWDWVNYVVFPAVAICLLALGWNAMRRRVAV